MRSSGISQIDHITAEDMRPKYPPWIWFYPLAVIRVKPHPRRIYRRISSAVTGSILYTATRKSKMGCDQSGLFIFASAGKAWVRGYYIKIVNLHIRVPSCTCVSETDHPLKMYGQGITYLIQITCNSCSGILNKELSLDL